MDVLLRDAEEADLDAVREVYRRSALSNDADRDVLVAHPEVLELAPTAILEGRTRVAYTANREVVAFASTSMLSDALEIEDLFVDPG